MRVRVPVDAEVVRLREDFGIAVRRRDDPAKPLAFANRPISDRDVSGRDALCGLHRRIEAQESRIGAAGTNVARFTIDGGALRPLRTEVTTYDPRQRDVLTEGLVLTIEPLVSAGSARAVEGSDGWTVRTIDGSFAAHHEHTLVITKGAPIVLTDRAA